jgi:hypothetical protein
MNDNDANKRVSASYENPLVKQFLAELAGQFGSADLADRVLVLVDQAGARSVTTKTVVTLLDRAGLLDHHYPEEVSDVA